MLNRFGKAEKFKALTSTNASITTSQTAPHPAEQAEESLERYNPRPRDIFGKARKALFNRFSLIIVVLSLVAVTIAYQFHPAMQIKFGGGYDLPYLDSFGGEVRFDQSNRGGDVTDSDLPTEQQKADPAIVLDAKGKRVPEPVNENYRWTTARSIVLLPGAGAYNSKLTLKAAASPLYLKGQQVQVLLNGQTFKTFTVTPGAPATFSYDFGKERFQNGNMAVEFRVTNIMPRDNNIFYDAKSNYKDGFKLYSLTLESQPGGGFALPDLKTTLAVTVSSFVLFVLLAYAGVAQLVAFGVAAIFTLAVAVILGIWRLELTIFTTRLALLLVLSGVALLVFDLLLPRLFKNWNVPLPGWAWRGLMVLFLAGMFLRGSGTLYPQTVVIDEPYHINVINTVLGSPDGFIREYTNKDASKVPGHWTTTGIIPYSPFVHFYLAPFAALPVDRGVTVNLISTFLDASRVLVIYLLAIALGLGARAALVGAGLYLLIPATYLLNSWGNWPTTVSLWMAVLYLALALLLYPRLNRKGVWWGLTVLLTLTMLGYSVTMVFMGMVLYLWAAGLFFFLGRKDAVARRNGKLVFLSATVAALASVAIYYWQFFSDLIPTLTSFDSALTEGQGLGLGERGFFDYLWLYTDHIFNNYGTGIFLALAFTVLGFALFAPRALTGSNRNGLQTLEPNATMRSGYVLWFCGAWFAVFIIFGLAQWKIDMVDKQVWFIIPLVVALAGLAFSVMWRKLGLLAKTQNAALVWQWAGRLAVTAIVLWISYSALSLWIYRIFFKRH